MENQQEPTKTSNPATWVILIIVIIIALGVGVYFLFFQEDGTNTNNTNTTVNTNTAVNGNINTSNNTNSTGQYKDNKLGFTIDNPDQLDIKTYDNSLSLATESNSVQLACAVNYTRDLELHPQEGEIIICFNAFANDGSLNDWYNSYSQGDSSNNNLYETVENETIEINGYTGIKENITTGAEPTEPKDTEWLNGKKLNYYFSVDDYVLQIESMVLLLDSQLLEYTSKIVNSIKF